MWSPTIEGNMNNKTLLSLLAGVLASTLALPAAAQKLCVYDLLGTAGDMNNMAKDFAVHASREGVKLEVKSYTDERVATEDLLAGQCDALMATGFRTRRFNSVAGSLDALGVSTIVRNGKVDIDGSYQVVLKTAQTFAMPAAQSLMVRGDYEVGGIIPFGAAYPVLNDRNIKTVEALAGKKITAFDYDKAQAVMIQKIGAQPVSADITSFAGKFNNGSVDMIVAPASAYRPLELHRGIGTKGAMNRFPVLIMTYQVILNKSRFPEGFGQKSRSYWLTQFDRARALITKAEKDVPAAVWSDLTPENMIKYTIMLRDSRIQIAEDGIYDKQGLKIIKRVRCSINAADSECSTPSESWK